MFEESDDPIEQDVGYEKLQTEDVAKEIHAFLGSPANYARMLSIASTLAAGVTGLSAGDLLHEAVVRFYEGRRSWPRGVHPLVVFKSAMRSIASDTRKHNARSPVDETVALATDGVDEASSDTRRQVHGTLTLTPEDAFRDKQQLAAVCALVLGDEDLELLVEAWADELRGAEAVEALGWDTKKYEAARKRLTRRLSSIDRTGD